MDSQNIRVENLNKVLNLIAWDKMELIPVVIQDITTLKVLMLAYTNKDSFSLSLQNGIAYYYSRSKERIWKKGEESGHIQRICEIYIDCDGDAILFKVDQSGVACHSGEFSCFYKKLDISSLMLSLPQTHSVNSPYHTLDILYHTLQDKKLIPSTESYTATLYAKGDNTICKKIVEEAAELTFALKDGNESEIIYECADLLYHTLVGLSYKNISPDKVMRELERRFGTSGIIEKQNRGNKV